MDTTTRGSANVERLVTIVLFGLAGCAITIAATATPEQLTTTRMVGASLGIFLGFVAIAGVVDTVRGSA